jgi:hypothetical protein
MLLQFSSIKFNSIPKDSFGLNLIFLL